MALIQPACAEYLRGCLRRLRLPRPVNIFLFGFDPRPEEDLPHATCVPRRTAGVAEGKEAKRRGPKAGAVRMSYDQIGHKIEEWCGRYSDFPGEVSLERLSEETGLFKAHLLKYFQYHLKKDFRLWKLEKKIACAQRLLRDKPDMMIADISLRAGFNNSANFFRQFKRIVGCTPQEWRSVEQSKISV